MEFSYRVTEAEYRSAWKLRRRQSGRPLFRLVMFWVFILICLMLLWAVVSRSGNQPNDSQNRVVTQQQQNPQEADASPVPALLFNVGPFIILICVWVYLVFLRVPIQLRRAYQKDPMMQGLFTLTIEPASITIRNSAGTMFQSGWNVFENWREGRGVMVLLLRSGATSIISLAGLADHQRGELRSILSAALPKK